MVNGGPALCGSYLAEQHTSDGVPPIHAVGSLANVNVAMDAALHDLDPVFRSFSRSPKVAALVRQLLGYRRPLPVQSMYIFKVCRLVHACLIEH